MTDINNLLEPEDREIITSALRDWAKDGVERPLIPMDVDVDGDGIVDAWGLDAFGNLIVVSGIDLKDTVYVADGSGIEATPIEDIDPDGIRGAESWVFRDGQRLTPAMAYDFDGLNNEFHARTGHWLRVRSGVRTDAEHLAIWYERYTRTPNGRRIYDTRWWNGVPWYRVSPAGTVAVPGTSNHQINIARGQRGALDIYDTGSDAGVLTRGSFRARVFDEIAGKYGYDSEGYNFGETWHKRYNRDPWRAVPTSGGNNTTTKTSEEDNTMLMLNVKIGKAVHKCTLDTKVFRHFVGSDPYEYIKNLARTNDDWQDIDISQLPALLRTYGCDLNIWDVRNGAFCVLDPLDGSVKPGNMWSAENAVRRQNADIEAAQKARDEALKKQLAAVEAQNKAIQGQLAALLAK
ncbi:lysin A [Microbacterium phage Neptune]|nr:lysin A [Microbacterium phage Neptune]UDL15514.1 lysin A [Microbacterium phage Cybele]